MRIPSGTTDQYIYFVAVDETDLNTRETGLSSFTVHRSRNGAAAAAMTTPTINETDSVNMPGVYELLLDEDMTIGAGNDSEEMIFHITHTGMAPVTRTIELYRPKITEGQTLSVSSGTADADVTRISGGVTAANNLESQYNGTGLTGGTFPATQEQVGNIAIAGAATNVVCESYNLTTGTQSSGTFADTQSLDGTSHEHTDSAGVMELYYQFDVTNSGVPTSVKVVGRLSGANDELGVYAYDWAGATWDQVGILRGTNNANNETNIYDLYTTHVGTGSDAGKVRVRFYAASGLSSATLYVDQILLSYAQLDLGIVNGSTITLTSSTTNENLIGRGWYLALGGQDISGSYFFQSISVSGVGTVSNGSPFIFQQCQIATATLSAYGFFELTAFSSTTTFTSTSGLTADVLSSFNCFSSVAGAGSPTFDFSGVTKETNIQFRGYLGGGTWVFTADCVASIEVLTGGTHTITTGGGDIEFRGAPKAIVLNTSGSGTTNIVVFSGCPITINGTGGTVNIYGVHGVVTDNSSGTTITDFGTSINNIDLILSDTGTDGVAISSATANQIADSLLNRDFSSVSDTNARTLLNAARFLRNKYSVSGSTLTVTKEDDTTSAWTATLTTDAGADPVTGSDPA